MKYSYKFTTCLAVVSALVFGLGNLTAQVVSFDLVNAAAGVEHSYIHSNNMGGGAAFFDYDNDGWQDLWLSGGLRCDQLFKNNGDGTFSNVSASTGIYAMDTFFSGVSAITGDIDNDGDRDIFITTLPGSHNRLYLNNGDGTFSDISMAAGVGDTAFSMSAAFGDINLDGYIDLFVGNYMISQAFTYDTAGVINGFDPTCEENFFYLNNGDNTFTEMSDMLGLNTDGCVLATAFTDFDGDADCDLLIANDFGEFHVPNELHENAYPGLDFNDISVASNADVGMYGMGIGIGDYDHDQDLDYYVTNIGLNHLYQNNGSGAFDDATFAAGVEDIVMTDFLTIGWGAVFRDFDNDTWDDLFVSNGHIPAALFIKNDMLNKNRLFYNNGDGTFTNIADTIGVGDGGMARGLASADFDKDGQVDLLVFSIKSVLTPATEEVLLYRNTTNNSNNYLQVELTGVYNNRDAYGSQIQVTVGGESWIHEINGGSSHASQNSSIAHFGLGTATLVDELLVTWPGGEQQQYEDVAANQIFAITEDSTLFLSNQSTGITSSGLSLDEISFYPNPATDAATLNFSLERPTRVQFELYDMTGKLRWRWNEQATQAGEQTATFNLRLFEPGAYQLRINAEDQSETISFVKQ